jgi:hypothetical protein
VLRLPRVRLTAADGSDTAMTPRPVGIPVTRARRAEAERRDSRIEAAVEEWSSRSGLARIAVVTNVWRVCFPFLR